MPLLLSMSVTGGIAMLIYLLIEPLLKRFLPLIWRKICLCIVAMFFLYPFAYKCNIYRTWLRRVFQVDKNYKIIMFEGMPVYDTTSNFIQYSENGIFNKYLWVYVLLIIVLLIGLVLFVKEIYQHIRIYHYWRKQDTHGKKLEKGELRTVKQDGVLSPFVIGVIKPIIVLPSQSYTKEEESLLMQHEKNHIRQFDNFLKVIVGLIFFVNYYNPLVYVFVYKWNLVTEMLCDKRAVKNQDGGILEKYGILLLQTARKRDSKMIAPISGLNVHYRMTKARICELKRKPEHYYWLGAMSVLIILLASVSIVLYQPREIRESDNATMFETIEGVDYSDWILLEHICIDMDEELIRIDDEEYIEKIGVEISECTDHNMEECTIINHIPTQNGGCISEYWDGLFCRICHKSEKVSVNMDATTYVCDYYYGGQEQE